MNLYNRTHEISTGNKGGSKLKISEEISEKILIELDENHFLSLEEMLTFLMGKHGDRVTTISNFLHGKRYSCRE